MKRARVSVPWKEGLHLRVAADLVTRAQKFRSSITLKVKEQVADAGSIFSILMLCATLGAVVDIEVSGDDEEAAFDAVASVFQLPNGELPEESRPDDEHDPVPLG